MSFLAGLTEFNPALAYAFDPESMENESIEHPDPAYINHGTSQFEDVYNAYLYAQDTILTDIRGNGIHNLQPNKLLEWLNSIHLRMSLTIANDYKIEGGRYIKDGEEIIRFHAGQLIQKYLILLLGATLTRAQSTKIIQKVANEFSIDADALQAFINLAVKYRTSATSNDPDVAAEIGADTLKILVKAHWNGTLDENEKAIVKKIFTVCVLPAAVPAAMDAFVKKTIENWIKCDKKSIDEVSTLLSDSFLSSRKYIPISIVMAEQQRV